jgi:predicted GNAT superfamily acetyltransferase
MPPTTEEDAASAAGPGSGTQAHDDIVIRPADSADFAAILRLNREWEHFTSPLDEPALARLHAQAAYHRVAVLGSRVVAFLLALEEGADYDSLNYRWFEGSYPSFLYVDRVVIARDCQGRGIGAALYDDLFVFARQTDATRVVCEVDVEPANEPSGRFHDRYGFVEVGTQLVAGGTKRVSLREVRLAPGDPGDAPHSRTV